MQATIYEFCLSNPASEYMFQKFDAILKKQIENIESISKEQANRKGDSEKDDKNDPSNLDKPSLKKIINLMKDKESVLLGKVLKFIQLFVEGHNIKLQKYLRKQKNSRNNYDLVTGTIEILKSYYYNACINGMYNNITKCFNTIIEFV